MTRPSRIVACPTCRKSVAYDASNPFRPFCSERCKVHDTAGWADESFRIPGEPHYDPQTVQEGSWFTDDED
jgi:hypothetical protein